jgi:predicted dinucleotide-binding enzyme
MSETVIAIIGPGRVGVSLGNQWLKAGYRVVYGSRDPSSSAIRDVLKANGRASAVSIAEAAAQADIILLAVPWETAETTLNQMAPTAGKIIIDATNLFAFRGMAHIKLDVPTSGGEIVQEWAPKARVVKGFNTTNWRVMADLAIAKGPVSIPLAGDDAQAKAKVAEVVRAIGFEPVDTGPLSQSRHLEHMAFLYVDMFIDQTIDTIEFHLRPRRKRQEASIEND